MPYLDYKKEKKYQLCTFCRTSNIKNGINRKTAVSSSTAAQRIIISEQAEGPFKISVLNNHTQDLTPNEMMRGGHRSRQISAACFALAGEAPMPHMRKHTRTHTYTDSTSLSLLPS